MHFRWYWRQLDVDTMSFHVFSAFDCTKSDCRYNWPSGATYRPMRGS